MVAQAVAHIGFHKTASTLVQKRVFVPEHGFHSPWPIRFHVETIVRSNPYLDRTAELRDAYGTEFARAREKSLVPVITHEALLGHPFGHGNRYATTRHVEQIVQAFPETTVVVVIREQVSMLVALYKQGVHTTQTWSPASFAAFDDRRVTSFAPEFLEYSWPLLHLEALLGPEQLKVVPFEWLVRSPQTFVDAFAAISGRSIDAEEVVSSRVHPGLTAREADFKRIGNRVLPHGPARARADNLVRRASRSAARLAGERSARSREQVVREQFREAVGSRYAESNAALESHFNLGLAELGYRL